ncbi:MAG: aldehyde:ferredoxin oxidoreductase [Thermoplasmata archaeon]|nr:MAG: aldehyde:ferredoxin oxidoreductase [Thermoplasmata archaeon]
MPPAGMSGKMLWIDLSKPSYEIRDVPEEWYEKYLGGNGFATKILFDMVKERVEPLSAENPVVITPGVFNALPVPTGGKCQITSVSPLTGTFSDSTSGSPIGAEIKHAGYDALVIVGKAERPTYVVIRNEKVEFKDATPLWGMTTHDTQEEIRRIEGDRRMIVASIGPAGERLVRFACVDSDHRQFGRGGLGAVWGYKNLKALAVRGTLSVRPKDPRRALELLKRWTETMKESPAYRDDTKYGTGEFLEWMNRERGTFPTRNWREGVFKEREKIDPYYWAPRYSIKNKACYGCCKPCGQLFVIREGPYKGTALDGIEYETLFALGSNVGNPDVEALAKANLLCDQLGMDTISTGGVIGWAMESYERGVLTDEDTGGVPLTFGNPEALLKMIEKIAHREGLGDLLAEGVKRAAEKLNKGSEEWAVHVKGQEPPAYDVRGIKGMGLGFMVSHRGACHLKSGVYALELTGKFWRFEGVDRFSAKNKGREIKEMEDFMAVYDTLGVCKFSRGIYLLQNYRELLEANLGISLGEEELLRVGERLNNMKRVINLRQGITWKDDSLPRRIKTLPIPEGPSKGSYITEEEEEEMRRDYYRARGWREDGTVPEEKLKELGVI